MGSPLTADLEVPQTEELSKSGWHWHFPDRIPETFPPLLWNRNHQDFYPSKWEEKNCLAARLQWKYSLQDGLPCFWGWRENLHTAFCYRTPRVRLRIHHKTNSILGNLTSSFYSNISFNGKTSWNCISKHKWANKMGFPEQSRSQTSPVITSDMVEGKRTNIYCLFCARHGHFIIPYLTKIAPASLWGWCWHSHFIDQATEAKKSKILLKMTMSRLQSRFWF